MIKVLVIHKIEDYEKWKTGFDEHGTVRESKGSKGASIMRNAKDPKEIAIITEWENMESAENFAEAEDLKIAMQKAGVTSQPIVYYLEELEKTTF
jgi:heme-degrading monooxygenase HmoA